MEPDQSTTQGDEILLIDHRSLTRQCLIEGLTQQWPGVRITAVSEPADAFDGACSPGLVLLNVGATKLNTPRMLAIVRRMVERLRTVPLVILADSEEIEDVVWAMQLGARGYVSSDQDLSELAEVLRFVRAGGTFVPAQPLIKCAPQLVAENPYAGQRHGPLESLTPRETQVLERVRQGKPNKIIAHELAISESTVKVFVRRILAKLHAVNRTEVAYLTRGRPEGVPRELV
jgi:DNA-binding NarL/FixJ family response regulator